MMSWVRKSFVTSLLLLLTACSAELSDYQQSEPKFDLFGYFEGKTKAWGMVQDYTDKQTRRFEVDIEGHIIGNTLTLNEDFVFDDGEKSQRVWAIQRSSNGFYIGRADDVIGDAIGQEVGNALQWKYDFLLKMDDGEIEVTFDDWLYRQDETRVFNITKIKKFGIEVGRVTLFFEKSQ